eukprot:scaffold6066_cov161-Amphora_coffeaeformis.AAC.1
MPSTPQLSSPKLDDLAAPVPLPQNSSPGRFPALAPSPRYTQVPAVITVTNSTSAFPDDASTITLLSDLQPRPQKNRIVPLPSPKPQVRGLVSDCFGGCVAVLLEGNNGDDSIRGMSEMGSPRARSAHYIDPAVAPAMEHSRLGTNLKPVDLPNAISCDENMRKARSALKSNAAAKSAPTLNK